MHRLFAITGDDGIILNVAVTLPPVPDKFIVFSLHNTPLIVTDP